MALTPEGTPYIESTDLVANYPAASLSLANRIDLVGVLPFADAAARTAAIAAPTDGQFTYLQDTNSTEFYNGSAYEALVSGKILQVLNVVKVNVFSTTSSTFVDVTDLTLTITPATATNKVLLFINLAGSTTDVSNTGNAGYRILRDSTAIGLGTGGSSFQFSGVLGTRLLGDYAMQQPSATVLDSPATTSAVTYKIQARTEGGTVYVNQQRVTENGMISTLTLMEVSA